MTAESIIAGVTERRTKNDPDRVLLGIPAKRWFLIRKRMQLSSSEIADDLVMKMVVAANELHRQETGRDAFEWFSDATFGELSVYLGLMAPDQLVEASDDDESDGESDGEVGDGEPKSDDVPAGADRDADLAAGAAGDLDGRGRDGAGVPEIEGPDVHRDGPVAG